MPRKRREPKSEPAPEPLLANDTPLVECRNPLCPYAEQVQLDWLHETGFCVACCPTHAELGCEVCWPEWDDEQW
jgi:hypothetical protein